MDERRTLADVSGSCDNALINRLTTTVESYSIERVENGWLVTNRYNGKRFVFVRVVPMTTFLGKQFAAYDIDKSAPEGALDADEIEDTLA